MEVEFIKAFADLSKQIDVSKDEIKKEFKDEIASLAASTKQQFDEVGEQFDEVGKRFKSVDEQFKSVNERFKSVDEQFKSVGEEFKSVNERFDTVGKQIEAAKTELKADIKTVDSKLEKVVNTNYLLRDGGDKEYKV